MENHWKEEHNTLAAEFSFADFSKALAFVNKVGAAAEAAGHHPDICIKDYNVVTISMTTHDAGGVVTEKDRALAKEIDALVSE